MVVTQNATSRKVQFKGIENKVLRDMTADQLVAETDRVERDWAQFKQAVRDMPFERRNDAHVKREKRCLKSERNRIYEERVRRMLAAEVAA